ncbi:hypothetical protein Tco_0733181 [Tanacetum coccineum]
MSKSRIVTAMSSAEAEYAALSASCAQMNVVYGKEQRSKENAPNKIELNTGGIIHNKLASNDVLEHIRVILMYHNEDGNLLEPSIQTALGNELTGLIRRYNYRIPLLTVLSASESFPWSRSLILSYVVMATGFWSTVMEEQLHALVDGKKIIITESSVRRDLQLADEEGEKYRLIKACLISFHEVIVPSSNSFTQVLASPDNEKEKVHNITTSS